MKRVAFNLTGNQVESIITNWGSVGNGNGSCKPGWCMYQEEHRDMDTFMR